MKINRLQKAVVAPGLLGLALCLQSYSLQAENAYKQTNLVSDLPGWAVFTDPNLVNPWGLVASPTSAWWVSDAGTGRSTLYNGGGVPQALVVSVPGPGGAVGAPTGQVFNGGTAFGSDRFIFATEDGTIDGWRGALGTTAEILLDNSGSGSVYKGLAISSIGANSYLYASDFHNGRIQVLASTGAPTLSGTFLDPTMPAGYAPFNIQNLGGTLYVTYAKQDSDAHDDVAGLGNGYVSAFDLSGNFLRRFASNGPLDSPWGLAMAPASFGSFAGDLLVGNFGNGMINAFDPMTGAFLDSLRDADGNSLAIDGLWGIAFGNGSGSGPLGTLYFTAGIAGPDAVEDHGLFGSISAVPEPGTGLMGAALVGFCGVIWARRRKAKTTGAPVVV